MKLTLKHVLAAIVLSSSFAAQAAVGQAEDASAAYLRGDYVTAHRLSHPLAEQGDMNAQSLLGAIYHDGLGVPQDYAEAARWFRLAADQGHATAQFNLGLMYNNGQGVPQDYAEAVRWYRLAADQDIASAQSNLGFMYNNGQGVPQDYVRAHMWWNLSAAQGNEKGLVNRDLIAQRMTPEQIAEAQRLAREWRPTTQPPQ